MIFAYSATTVSKRDRKVTSQGLVVNYSSEMVAESQKGKIKREGGGGNHP